MKFALTNSFAAIIPAALILTACGKQEAVSDVPSSEELARQADAASQAIRDEAAANAETSENAEAVDSAEMESYANALRGYSIMVPKGWVQDEETSDDNGRTYTNEPEAAILKIGWAENREDETLQAAVKTLEEAGVAGEFVKENEYRASGKLSDEENTTQRILRKPDGSMVSAAISYPAKNAEKLSGVADQILDSLTLQ